MNGKRYRDHKIGEVTVQPLKEGSEIVVVAPDDKTRHVFSSSIWEIHRRIQEGKLIELPDEPLPPGRHTRTADKLRRLCEAYGDAVGKLYNYGSPTTCNHEFVNMGFMHLRLVCKHCNAEKDS